MIKIKPKIKAVAKKLEARKSVTKLSPLSKISAKPKTQAGVAKPAMKLKGGNQKVDPVLKGLQDANRDTSEKGGLKRKRYHMSKLT
jgi:hypothetical protein